VNFKVKVRITNPPSNLRPGFSVAGQIETDKRQNAVAIPVPALVVADEELLKKPEKGKKGPPPTAVPSTKPAGTKKKEVEGVFVLGKDGVVQFKKVKTGITAELEVEVTDGLEGGEEIVTGPFKALRALKIGDKVKVDNSLGAGPGAEKKG
jgi:HlyD family secretion protein